MLKKYTYKQKLKMLGVAAVVLLLLCYRFSVSQTLSERKTYQEQKKAVAMNEGNAINLQLAESRNRALNKMLEQFVLDTLDESKNLLGIVSRYCDDHELELKEYKTGQLYYNLQQYRAAGISFTNLLNSYPESPKGEEYMLMAIKSYYAFAKLSVIDKQEERYQKVSTEYFDFADRYPESKLLKEAENYKNLSLNNIKQIQNEQIKTPAER